MAEATILANMYQMARISMQNHMTSWFRPRPMREVTIKRTIWVVPWCFT